MLMSDAGDPGTPQFEEEKIIKTPINPRQDGAEGLALRKSADNASHNGSLYVAMGPVYPILFVLPVRDNRRVFTLFVIASGRFTALFFMQYQSRGWQ